jgi:hypothetical protein
MSRHPVMRKNAEEHFIEALRLAHDAELHYWLVFIIILRFEVPRLHRFRSTLRTTPNTREREKAGRDRKERGQVIGQIRLNQWR